MQLALTGIVVVLLVAWFFLHRRNRTAPSQESERIDESGGTAYHAVSIKFDANACEAAKAMSGRRFLSSAAPRLPLPECNVLDCRCRFAHHEDRRSGKDRRSPFAAAGFRGGSGSFDRERRQSAGRRRDDSGRDDD